MSYFMLLFCFSVATTTHMHINTSMKMVNDTNDMYKTLTSYYSYARLTFLIKKYFLNFHRLRENS